MNLGFIGTGALTSAIVTGLKSAAGISASVLLSPRNKEVAASLASRYPDVRVGRQRETWVATIDWTRNQAPVDCCTCPTYGSR